LETTVLGTNSPRKKPITTFAGSRMNAWMMTRIFGGLYASTSHKPITAMLYNHGKNAYVTISGIPLFKKYLTTRNTKPGRFPVASSPESKGVRTRTNDG